MQTARKLSPAVAPGRAAVPSFMGRKAVYLQRVVSHSFELDSKCDFEIANCTAVKVICVMVPHRNTNGQRHAMP